MLSVCKYVLTLDDLDPLASYDKAGLSGEVILQGRLIDESASAYAAPDVVQTNQSTMCDFHCKTFLVGRIPWNEDAKNPPQPEGQRGRGTKLAAELEIRPSRLGPTFEDTAPLDETQ